MPQAKGSVIGSQNQHRVQFFGISTCIWCKRTRQFLEERGVAFDYVYVDLLHGQEQEEAKAQVRHWNPSLSFPTVVVDDARCVIGYRPEELAEALGL